MAKKTNEITKAPVNNEVPNFIAQTPSGQIAPGFENTRSGDIILPRLVLMQALSPDVVEKRNSSGQILNSVTRELMLDEDEYRKFIPLYHYLEWIKWGDKKKNESILAMSLDPDGELAQSAMKGEKRINAEGKEVRVVTEYHNFIVVFPDMVPMIPVVISCSKSNHRRAKQLLSLARFRGNYPLYSGQYTLKAEMTENKDHQKYYVYGFENAGWVANAELLEEITDLHVRMKEAFKSRRLATDHSHEDESAPETEL
jgi:hypothetical protein